MVAQQTSNLKVVGSIPTSDVIFIFMKSLTDRSADLRLLHSSRVSTDSNAYLSVALARLTFERPTGAIPGTKTRLEVAFGRHSETLSFEPKGSASVLPIDRSFQFEYRQGTDLTFALHRKSPLFNTATGVALAQQLASDKIRIKMRDFLVPFAVRVPLKGAHDKPEAFLEVVLQTRVNSTHRFSEEPKASSVNKSRKSKSASPSEPRQPVTQQPEGLAEAESRQRSASSQAIYDGQLQGHLWCK